MELPVTTRQTKTQRNAAGQRLGHHAAQYRELRNVINAFESKLDQLTLTTKRRDEQIVASLDQVTKALYELAKFCAEQQTHRSTQNDLVLRQLITAVSELVKSLEAQGLKEHQIGK